MSSPEKHVRTFLAPPVRPVDDWRNLPADRPRMLTGRIVPYGEVADVVDYVDGRPDLYREGFRSGAFAPQLKAGVKRSKIGLVHKHDGSGLGFLGPFEDLRESGDGLWGDVRILPSRVDDVDALLKAGVDELSVEFRLARTDDHTSIDDTGVRWRCHAHLDGVALEPTGAYRSAQVLQFRQAADEQNRKQAETEAAEAADKAAEAAETKAREAADADAAERVTRRKRFDQLAGRYDETEAYGKRQAAELRPVARDYYLYRQRNS